MYFEIYGTLLVSTLIFSRSLEANRSVTNEEVSETTRETFSNGSIVTELQHTICSIKTDEIVAKAQSTASRSLMGICTSKDMAMAFETIEKSLLKKLEEVQQNLTLLIQSKLTQSVDKKKDDGYRKVSTFRAIKKLIDKNLFEDSS